jgi:thymidylate synthase (FAD)
MILIKPSYEIRTEIDRPTLLRRIEAAGRTCYKSEDKMTDDSASKFVSMVIKRGHESVIEHESLSVRFIVDRGVTHEMVRHRLVAFSQESTRYCDYSGDGVYFIVPPWVNIEPGQWTETVDHWPSEPNNIDMEWFLAMLQSECRYNELRRKGWTPQQARSVLPNSLKTEIVMTTNLREWRHVLKLRTSHAAHPQMREIMVPLLEEFTILLPEIFGDILVNLKSKEN